MTTGCATSSMSSGSRPTATSRSPAGPSRACASMTCRSRFRSPCRRSTRASGSTTSLGGTLEIAGQQPRDHAHRGPGHAARLRQRRWDLRRLTPWGQELTLTAYGRGDVYHTDDAREHDGRHLQRHRRLAYARPSGRLPPTSNGRSSVRCSAACSGSSRVFNSSLTPPTPNIDIPNEDARSVDLEDSNLFALNRFPGYDRWEDASRITYGLDWSLERPNLSIDSTIGQSYRFVKRAEIFPEGTGLTDRCLGHRRTNQDPLRTVHRPHAPLPHRQGQFRGSAQRDRSDHRHDADLCADRLSQAQPRTSIRDRGSARPGGTPRRGADHCSRATGRSSARPSST